MRFTTVLLVAFACSGAFASEPGQPLDCSDWVFLRPGLACADVVPFPCLDAERDNFLLGCESSGDGEAFNNEGEQLIARVEPSGTQLNCTGFVIEAKRLAIWALNAGGTGSLIAYLRERCSPSGVQNVDGFFAGLPARVPIKFDPANGVLRVNAPNLGCLNGPCGYLNGTRLMAIHGFASTFEVLQTYTPEASLGFRVPYMPEGMPAADSFDTYWGPLARPIDFTQAHALQCDYPAAAPHVGDYLTVADTVPTPAPGQGVYYVTSATYQGSTRYGRKAAAGQMSGRDPALLPACVP